MDVHDPGPTCTVSAGIEEDFGNSKSKASGKLNLDSCPEFFIGGDSDSDSDISVCASEKLSRSFNCHLELSSTDASSEHGCASSPRTSSEKSDQLNFQFQTMQQHVNDMSDKMSQLALQVKSLEGALGLERRQRLAAVQQSEARIDDLDKEVLQHSAELQKLVQEDRRSSATDREVMRSCIASIDQLSCALEKETKDRVVLEASMHKAMLELRADNNFNILDEYVTELQETRAEWQQLEGQTKEMRSGLDRIVDFEKEFGSAYKLILDEVAYLSQELKVEGEARQVADKNIRQELEGQQTQLDELSRKTQELKAEEKAWQIADENTKQKLEGQQSQLDELAAKTRILVTACNRTDSSCSESEASMSPRSACAQEEDQRTRLDDISTLGSMISKLF